MFPNFVSFYHFVGRVFFVFVPLVEMINIFHYHTSIFVAGVNLVPLCNRHSTHTELVCLSDDTFFTVCMHLNLLMLFSSISKILLFNSDAKIGSTRKREKTKERYINSDLERKKCSSSFPEENNNRFCCKKLNLVFFPGSE